MSNPILPLASPQFLTESLFQNYGFFTGSATNFQIQAAFSIAENQCAIAVGTFLAPTTYTGNVTFLGTNYIYEAPVGKLNSILSVTFREQYSNGLERLVSGTAVIVDKDNGYFVVKESAGDTSSCNGCGSENLGISSFDIVINAGYPSGVAMSSPSLQLALCMSADIALKLMYDEGIGVIYENLIRTQQVGRVIQSFETRFFGQTIFGPSSRGNFIQNLLRPYMITRVGRLG